MSNAENIKYTVLNDKCNVINCYKIGRFLFINLQLLYNIEIMPQEALIILDDINLITQRNTFALTSTTPTTMADTIRISTKQNKILLESSTSPTNKYGHGFIQIIAVIL